MEKAQIQAHNEEANPDAFQKMMDDNGIDLYYQAKLRGIPVDRIAKHPGTLMEDDVAKILDGVERDDPASITRVAGNFFATVEMNHLDSCKFGGGNPAYNCLEEIQKRFCKDKLESLLTALGNHQMPKDVIQNLRKERNIRFIGDLKVADLQAISDHMSEDAWRGAAIKFEFDAPEIKLLAGTISAPNKFSRTSQFFDTLRINYPDTPLYQVFNAFPRKCQMILFDYMMKMASEEEPDIL